jgi:hypothetical protein
LIVIKEERFKRNPVGGLCRREIIMLYKTIVVLFAVAVASLALPSGASARGGGGHGGGGGLHGGGGFRGGGFRGGGFGFYGPYGHPFGRSGLRIVTSGTGGAL